MCYFWEGGGVGEGLGVGLIVPYFFYWVSLVSFWDGCWFVLGLGVGLRWGIYHWSYLLAGSVFAGGVSFLFAFCSAS